MKIEIGREYNLQSQHRKADDYSYIFRGIVTSHRYDNVWNVTITEFNVSKGQSPGDQVSIDEDRFRSLVARTNLEAKRLLSKEW